MNRATRQTRREKRDGAVQKLSVRDRVVSAMTQLQSLAMKAGRKPRVDVMATPETTTSSGQVVAAGVYARVAPDEAYKPLAEVLAMLGES